jgi:hypothetical protein
VTAAVAIADTSTRGADDAISARSGLSEEPPRLTPSSLSLGGEPKVAASSALNAATASTPDDENPPVENPRAASVEINRCLMKKIIDIIASES